MREHGPGSISRIDPGSLCRLCPHLCSVAYLAATVVCRTQVVFRENIPFHPESARKTLAHMASYIPGRDHPETIREHMDLCMQVDWQQGRETPNPRCMDPGIRCCFCLVHTATYTQAPLLVVANLDSLVGTAEQLA